jgi:hypothetical protein
MSTAPTFASVTEALDTARAALCYLATADAAQLAEATLAEVLRGLERADAISTAARASFLAAFTAGQGYTADADYSPRAWLMHQTGITRGCRRQPHRLGEADGDPSAGGGGAGRRRAVGFLRAHDLPVDG